MRLDLFHQGRPDYSNIKEAVELVPDSEGQWGLNDASDQFHIDRVAVCQKPGHHCVSWY